MSEDFVGLQNHVLPQILSMDPSSTFSILEKLNPLPAHAKTNTDTSQPCLLWSPQTQENKHEITMEVTIPTLYFPENIKLGTIYTIECHYIILNIWSSNDNFRCLSCSLRSFEVIMKLIWLRSKVKFKCNSTRRRCNNVVTDVLPCLILWRIMDHDW